MLARKYLQVETAQGAVLTVGDVARFLERCREVGIPDEGGLSSPGPDTLRRYPITFSVTWTEYL